MKIYSFQVQRDDDRNKRLERSTLRLPVGRGRGAESMEERVGEKKAILLNPESLVIRTAAPGHDGL